MKTDIRPLSLNDLRARITEYEVRYGVPSERLFDAFVVDGVFRESRDFSNWSLLYETWRDASARCLA